jgi:hypothetical protein
VRHEIGKGALLAALLQDFNLVSTWCRPRHVVGCIGRRTMK